MWVPKHVVRRIFRQPAPAALAPVPGRGPMGSGGGGRTGGQTTVATERAVPTPPETPPPVEPLAHNAKALAA